MAVTNSDSDLESIPEEILLQEKLIEASKNKSNSKQLSESPDSLSKNKILKTRHTKKRLQLKKHTSDVESDSEDSGKELEIMKTASKPIKEKKAKGKFKAGSTSDNETNNDITLKLSDSTIMPLTTSTPNINSKLIQAASLSTKKGVLQKILADSNKVANNFIKKSEANNMSNTPTKQLKGILKTSLQNIKNNQSDDSDSSSDKLPPSQWHSFQKKELEESSDSEASFSNAISSTQIPQSEKSFESDNNNKAQPVANRRQSITKNVSFDDSNLNEDNVKQSPKNKLQLKITNDSDSDSDASSEDTKETNPPQNIAQSSSDASSSESEDEVDATVKNMKQNQKNEPVKTIFENKSSSDSDSDNNSPKNSTQNNNMHTGSAKASSENDSSESEDESSTNKVTMKQNNLSASSNEDGSSSEDEKDVNEKTMNKNVVNTAAKSASAKVSNDSDNERKAMENSSSSDKSSDSDSEPEMKKDVKSVPQKLNKNKSTPQTQSTSSESSSDSDEEPQNTSKKQGNSFVSQQKLDNFPQTVLQQKNILKDISGSDNESSSDVSVNEEVKSPNKTSMQKKERQQREEISASESSDDEQNTTKNVSLSKRVNKLCDLSIVDTAPLLECEKSKTMYNTLKEYIITNPHLKKIDAKTNLLLDDLNEDEEVWLMQCPKVLVPNLLVGQKLKLDKKVKLKIKAGSNKYECISERSNDLNICVVASESAKNQSLAARIVKPVGTIVIHQMLQEKSPVRIEIPDRTKVEAPENLKTRHPIFGANYETKIELNDATHGKLITAELERRKAENKALKKKRRESVSRANEKDATNEIIYQLLNQTRSSINGNTNEDKKKSKKRKLSVSKDEHIAKVQKIDNIEKSEVDSSMKQPTKTKRKSKNSISISKDIMNDDELLNKSVDKSLKLQESLTENLKTKKMQIKSPQSAEKSKKKKKEKNSDNEKSIVTENETDLSNNTGKNNRKKHKIRGEAKLEEIKANADEYLTKSNETRLESKLASISDTTINDTALRKKNKKNKHKDENITMESHNASQIEKSLNHSSISDYQSDTSLKKKNKKNKHKDENITKDSQNASHIEKSLNNSNISEYQQNVYNSATKKSDKKNKNKKPEDPKPNADDTVTYSNTETVTEVMNNLSAVSEDSTPKKRHKKKKNKDTSVNIKETPALNDSTKLSVGNEELNKNMPVQLNVNNNSKNKQKNKNKSVNSINNEEAEMKDFSSKKKHNNKNMSVNSINNEKEEMKDFTPKKKHKHVEVSHEKTSELSTSITKKKSKIKSTEGDNFDTDQVINDLLSSIMQNTKDHSKDKSKKRKRESSDNIKKQVANITEHFVEVKPTKKSKKKHNTD